MLEVAVQDGDLWMGAEGGRKEGGEGFERKDGGEWSWGQERGGKDCEFGGRHWKGVVDDNAGYPRFGMLDIMFWGLASRSSHVLDVE